MTKKIKVAIIGGGFSNERKISLLTAREIMKALDREKYAATFIDIKSPKQALVRLAGLKTDVAFIALHGRFGEDGSIQAILETLGIVYTGSGVLASALAMDKRRCLDCVSKAGIRVARRYNSEKYSLPCVVKPNASGSSVGVSIVKTRKEFEKALKVARREDDNVLIEQYISGREFSCAVLGNSGNNASALPAIEIISHGRTFFDYQAKYDSKTTQEVCPALISKKIEHEMRNLSLKVHELLGCDGLTRSDFILSDKDHKLYFLEINTVPGQTQMSLAPKEALVAGMSFSRFVEKQVQLAKSKRKKL